MQPVVHSFFHSLDLLGQTEGGLSSTFFVTAFKHPVSETSTGICDVSGQFYQSYQVNCYQPDNDFQSPLSWAGFELGRKMKGFIECFNSFTLVSPFWKKVVLLIFFMWLLQISRKKSWPFIFKIYFLQIFFFKFLFLEIGLNSFAVLLQLWSCWLCYGGFDLDKWIPFSWFISCV